MLPIAAAIGGMVVPSLLYWSLNRNGPDAHGWGIPMATDIAFALGALALVAPNAPFGLKIFWPPLAIVDDMGAVLVIVIFYSGAIDWSALGAAAVLIVFLIGLNVSGVTKLSPHVAAALTTEQGEGSGGALWATSKRTPSSIESLLASSERARFSTAYKIGV